MQIVNPNGSGRLERLFYTVPEVSEMLAISRKSVYRLLARGLLKSSSAFGHKRISRTSIDEFIATTVNNGGDK